MSYLDRFNVFMEPYGAGGGSTGGSTGGNGDSVLGLGGIGSDSKGYKFVSSPYKFTDPPRFFKANDPYYFEVDNIPLKQLHENCLWLKDQIEGVNVELSGVPLTKITDLKAYVTNADRTVYVNPGRFTARVNDAYTLAQFFQTGDLGRPSIDLAASPIYKTPPIETPDVTFRTLVGSVVSTAFFGNGLNTHLQHHHTRAEKTVPTSENVPGGPITLGFTSNVNDYSDLPKVKTAAWRSSTDSPANLNVENHLQQLSVDFCRRWSGVFKTSVVSVPNGLSVNIPQFDPTDYTNNSTGDPTVRIDLVFVYTHPIDALDSHIMDATTSSPERLTAPRLGVVKGAGAILRPNSGALNITANPGVIGGTDTANWPVPSNANPDAFYDTSQAVGPGQNMAIQSVMSDQLAENITNNPFGVGVTFPSPDDLLNLAPIISEDAMGGSLATVGQSVLPLCYVLVKKDETSIKQSDIIDIRPFLRTTELTYNERAGVAAANPPLSIANPAVGRAEHYQALELLRDYLKIYTDDLIPQLTQDIIVERTECLPEESQVFAATPLNLGDSASPTDHPVLAVKAEHMGKVKSMQFKIAMEATDNPSNTSNKVFFRGGTYPDGQALITDDRLVAQFEGTNDAATAAMPHSFITPPIYSPGDPTMGGGTYKITAYSNSTAGNFNYKCTAISYTWEDTVRVQI